MSYQITKLDLIPKGEKPVCNVSQFDNGRVLLFEIYENGEAYNIPNDIRVDLNCRKPDGNIVTLSSETITDNIVTFLSTTQLTACFGENICEISLYGADDYLIGSLNFILEVEKDPLLGGINSSSEINNLREQIEDITEEVVGENYYNKTEVDSLLDDKANTSDVYTKSQVDSALALKANTSDVYTKSQVDNIILGIMPVDESSGAIATFNTEIAAPLVSVIADVIATGGNGTPDNPIPINGYTEANITRCGVNLWGGETMADSFVNVSDYSKNTSTKTFTFSADKTAPYDETLIKGCFKENTQYTIILRYTAASANNSVRVLYSDGTTTALTLSATNDKTDYILTTTSGKTVSKIFLTFYSAGVVTVYYDESGLFEGVKTVDDFTPYNVNTVIIAFGQAVYGGVLDVTSGKLTVTQANIASYNGESINEPWLSSMDTYVPNTTPTTGAQVVYPLATPFDIDLTPEVISAIVGTNNIFADCGNISVRFKTTIEDYINSHTGG